MHRSVHVLLALLVGSLAAVSTASAIVGGRVDGDAHPYVGALVVDGAVACSGVLVAPTVFATAAHCVEGLPDGSRVAVSFDSSLDPAGWTLRSGAAFADPAYRGRTSSDLAVVVLDGAAPVRPASLPGVGVVDALRRDVQLTSVGFGYSAVAGKREFVYDGRRHAAESPLKKVGPDSLTLSTRAAGPCLGDSGGPQLLGDTVLSVTSSGSKDCSGSVDAVRLDSIRARGFLGLFVALP